MNLKAVLNGFWSQALLVSFGVALGAWHFRVEGDDSLFLYVLIAVIASAALVRFPGAALIPPAARRRTLPLVAAGGVAALSVALATLTLGAATRTIGAGGSGYEVRLMKGFGHHLQNDVCGCDASESDVKCIEASASDDHLNACFGEQRIAIAGWVWRGSWIALAIAAGALVALLWLRGRLLTIGVRRQQLGMLLQSAFGEPEQLDGFLKSALGRNLDRTQASLPRTIDALLDEADAERWSARLVVELRRARPDDEALQRFASDVGLAPLPPRQQLERMIAGAGGLIDGARFCALWSERQSCVCRIEIRGTYATRYGSGFLIGRDLVITNHHVLKEVLDGRVRPHQVTVRFDFQQLADGKTVNEGVEHKLAADWNLCSSPPSDSESRGRADKEPAHQCLDFAVIRLATPAGQDRIGHGAAARPRGWIEIPDDSYDFPEASDVVILQHPKGGPQKMAWGSLLRVNANRTRVRYSTNTEDGASGSPCFTVGWTIIALHHSGDRSFLPRYNQGIPIDTIRGLLVEAGIIK